MGESAQTQQLIVARRGAYSARGSRLSRGGKSQALEKQSLRRARQQYLLRYHEERSHQGKGNRILFPFQTEARRDTGAVRCRERLGGLLKYYEREAA
jgi:putative transposase